MFTVEWLKDGNIVHREAMLGANISDTLKLARTRLDDVKKASGAKPDTLRITDHMTNRVATERTPYARLRIDKRTVRLLLWPLGLVAVALYWWTHA
jgi:hypothetical protein